MEGGGRGLRAQAINVESAASHAACANAGTNMATTILRSPPGYSVPRVKPLEDLLVPGTRLGGRYVIERRLGGGAMGAVYAATGPGGKHVAIKALLQEAAK